MKRFIIFFIAGVLIGQIASAQGWERQNSPTANTLNAVVFVNSSCGWAVGGWTVPRYSTTVHTSDGGDTWTVQNSDTGYFLHGVDFLDADNGWAVGGTGHPNFSAIILHTTDGGGTWTNQSSDSGYSLAGVDFVDASNGWAVGGGWNGNSSWGTIVHTTDWGETWTVQPSDTAGLLNAVDFVDANNGWAVGSGGTILHTTDGGGTWTLQSSGTGWQLNCVDFVNASNGWAVGGNVGPNNSTILRTTDGGGTWTLQYSDGGRGLYGVDFVDANNGWAVGYDGTILYTTDGGSGWIAQSNGTTNRLYGVAFVDGNKGWAVGLESHNYTGTILHHPGEIKWLSPIGGEILPIGDSTELRWCGDSFGGNVCVELNRDYPSETWETLFPATDNDGQETWAATGPPAWHARFRVQHLTIPDLSDTLNGDTQILFPGLYLLSPNGGETVLTGVWDTVTFARAAVPNILRLELNRNYPAGSWEVVQQDIRDASTAAWRVTMPATANARMRIMSQSWPVIGDTSDTDFMIRPPQMSLLFPNGGEQLPAGILQQIQWLAPEHQGNVGIALNRDYPTGNWELLYADVANDSLEAWTPSAPASEHCRIRLFTVLDSLTYAESAADFAITSLNAEDPVIPRAFLLSTPYPNPFNSSTTIAYDLPKVGRVSLRVFDLLGREVALLKDGFVEAGTHRVMFDGSNLASGIYFARLDAGAFSQTRKLMLLK